MKLGINHFNISCRVDDIGYVHNILIFEAAHYMSDGICFTNISQELIAEAFAFGGTFHQTRNINKLHRRWNDTLGPDDFRKLIQTRIGHWHDTRIWLDGAEGKILGGDAGLGEGIE